MAEDKKKKKKRKDALRKLRELLIGESKGTTVATQEKQIKRLGLL